MNSRESVTFQTKREDVEMFGKEVRKHWEITDHCSLLMFPASYPEISCSSRSCHYYYLLHTSSAVPDPELRRLVTQAHYRVLAKLIQSELQIKNFILPVQLMKLKYIDPYSRQRIIEQLCKYLSLQQHLKSVVLEQAGISLPDLCRLLLSLAHKSHLTRLYLWGALDTCELPFKGPFEGDFNLDDLPRIQYTYNPGGRKYLKSLKHEEVINGGVKTKTTEKTTKMLGGKGLRDSQVAWMACLQDTDGTHGMSVSNLSVAENYYKLLALLSEPVDNEDHVHSQVEVAVQCRISQVSMIPYDDTQKFITRSIPLNSLHIDSGFCPTLVKPQLTFYSTLKFLYHYFSETLEHISIKLWQSSGRIDSALEMFIKQAVHLRSFEYHGPLQYRTTIRKLCMAALLPYSNIVNFKLMLQGDPCYPQIARQLTAELYQEFQHRFAERSIQFELGTHCS